MEMIAVSLIATAVFGTLLVVSAECLFLVVLHRVKVGLLDESWHIETLLIIKIVIRVEKKC
jgi:hypothetical protein